MKSSNKLYSEKKPRFGGEYGEILKKIYPILQNENKNVMEFMDLDDSVEIELPNEYKN